MRDFRDKRRSGLLLIGALSLLLPAMAGAQSPGQAPGPPIPLIPPSAGTPGAGEPAEAPNVPGNSPASGIPAEPLAPLAPGWAGDTTPPGNPLPRNFWQGTPRALADTLLARLPDTTSPALQGIVRRLLLSPAAAPTGPDAVGVSGGLPMLRAALLLRLGEIEAARTVIAAVPERERAAALPVLVEADAIGGHIDDACGKVSEAIRRNQASLWQRALIACQIVHGDSDQAGLGLQVLADQNPEQKAGRDDPLIVAADALAGRAAPAIVEKLERADPLLLYALLAAKRRLAPAAVAKLRADLALTLALNQQAPADTRLVAAERAAACGALPTERLRELYADLAGDVSARSGGGAVERARRYTAIAAATAPPERLSRILAFAEGFPAGAAGRDLDGLLLAARVVAPALRDIAPEAALAGGAEAAARLLIAAGEYDRARRWVSIDPAGGPELLSILALVAEPAGASGESGRASRPVLLAMRAALGGSIDAVEWSRMPSAAWTAPGPAAPPPAAWLDLTDAAAMPRLGEAILASVLVAAPQTGLSKDPIALYAAVKGLDRAGLGVDARRLAVEAALGS
ncbi:MAG: hypothetical protein JO267_13635 [Alphaproteobacteria bacterium]|nr:hypothetical protein [Alphaproteobacteria bacterium]MBV9863177.1 hypothetical protein [Alphaproteobacteria bacterium]